MKTLAEMINGAVPGDVIVWPSQIDDVEIVTKLFVGDRTRSFTMAQQKLEEENHKSRLKVVFISGKYRAPTEWGVKQNIHAAEQAAMHVWQLGGVAICPHLNTAFFGGSCPDETWLAGDLELLRRCDAVYAMVDWRQSKGATAEVELAESLGLPVFFQRNVTSERELVAWLEGGENGQR